MRHKTVHISNFTKVFWKRVPEPRRCYHKSRIPTRLTFLIIGVLRISGYQSKRVKIWRVKCYSHDPSRGDENTAYFHGEFLIQYGKHYLQESFNRGSQYFNTKLWVGTDNDMSLRKVHILQRNLPLFPLISMNEESVGTDDFSGN